VSGSVKFKPDTRAGSAVGAPPANVSGSVHGGPGATRALGPPYVYHAGALYRVWPV